MEKITDELKYYLDREYKKLEITFQKVTFTGVEKEIWDLVLSYWQDCKYFYEKGDLVRAFELVNYIWGMLDILANLNMLKVPNEIKKWFKAEL